METFAAGFQHLVLHLFGWMLPAALLMWICAVLGSHGLGPLGPMRRLVASIPPVGRIVLLALLAGFIVHGSTKSGGGTHAPPPRMSAPGRAGDGQWGAWSAVTAEDVARGWRAVAFPGTETPVEMPAGAMTNDLLRRRGGCDWAFRVEPDGWRFPYRDGALTGVTVLARGEVRPDVGTPYFPVPVTNGVSLLPEARWGLLPDGGASVFSHAVTANGAFLEVDPGMLEERLERREGHRLPPTRVKIPANSDVVYSVTYQGRAASERKGDVEVTAALTAVNEMSPMPSTAEMTAVQVAIIPERPMGDLYRNRHRFGICEKVWCNIDPADLIVSWSSGQQGSMAVDGHYFKHHVPFAAQSYELTAEIEGVRLSCPVSSIFPSGVSAFNDPNYEIYAIVNQAAIDDAGWVGFEVSVYCAPTNVYFGNIEVREEPTPASSFTNYFSSSYWSGRRDHQGTAISLDWVSPKVENYMCEDQVSIDACPPPWLDGGTLVWRIPNVCRHSVDGVCQEHRYAYTEQSFSISSNGIVEVSKFGIHAMRAPGQTMSLRIDDGK